MARRQGGSEKPKACDLDFSEGVDEVDEIDGDEQLALVWCCTHGRWGVALDTAPCSSIDVALVHMS